MVGEICLSNTNSEIPDILEEGKKEILKKSNLQAVKKIQKVV